MAFTIGPAMLLVGLLLKHVEAPGNREGVLMVLLTLLGLALAVITRLLMRDSAEKEPEKG